MQGRNRRPDYDQQPRPGGGPEMLKNKIKCWLEFHDYIDFNHPGAPDGKYVICKHCGIMRYAKNNQGRG